MIIPVLGIGIGLFLIGGSIYSAAIKDFCPKLLFGGIALTVLGFVALL